MFKVHSFKSLDSTNNKAKSYPINSVIVSEEQTKGKGRFKRDWSSSKGGIYLSIVLENASPQYLTFIAAISVKKAIEKSYKIKTKIKWPNDLIFEKKKVCGILTEIKNNKVIVGIGINTNNKIPKPLKEKAISLKDINRKQIDNKKIIKLILNYFKKYYNELKDKNYNKIINDWKKNSFIGCKIEVKTLNKTYEGTAYNIDKDCFLVLKDKKGKKITIREGDVFLE